jgi:hypothetical protein
MIVGEAATTGVADGIGVAADGAQPTAAVSMMAPSSGGRGRDDANEQVVGGMDQTTKRLSWPLTEQQVE